MTTVITTSPDGSTIITTQDGVELAISERTENADIQLLDFSVDLLRALLWEYNEAITLQELLQKKQGWYDLNQRDFWQSWYDNVFNLLTANEFGLAVWSIILGLPLFIATPPDPEKPTFGFDLPQYGNFDNSNFTDSDGNIFNLPLEIKRIALRLRYYQLVSSGTVPETNRMLADVFKDYGKVYLLDYHNMTQAYIFLFELSADLQYLFNHVDILPRPAAVASTYVDATKSYFGFGPYGLVFDEGILGG